MTDQLALATECCKYRDCLGEVVGSSITGKGKVCSKHNSLEWGKRLSHKSQPEHVRRLGGLCLAGVKE